MKILINVGHPAHVHFYKNFIWEMENRGHDVTIAAQGKDVTIDLLKAYNFKYEYIGAKYKGTIKKIFGAIYRDYLLYKVAKRVKPDVLTGILDSYSAHVGIIIKKPSIIFTDTEEAKLSNILTFPFTSVICTPSCYLKELGKKNVRCSGYKELAYLHPNRFKPDISVLEELNISPGDPFIILRFISWAASHDIQLKGIKNDTEMEFIKSFERYGRVFITSERELDKKLEKYRLNMPPEKIHSLLHYAQLYIGEGGTMAAEAAILGTPAIHIESTSNGVATGELSGNFLELRDKYGLLYFYPDQNQALKKALSILENKNSKTEWQKKREKLLKDKIDVTAWMADFIERYPESFYEYKRGNNI
jgi:predicted glycosyltransferase